MSRVTLIRINALILTLLVVPLWGWYGFSFDYLLVFSAVLGVLQFTLYPLGAAFANDNVDPERRVGLSAILYMVYGVGACIGPLLVGFLMGIWGRSEEHTSELQSLMRISYAVFCLKKKKNTYTQMHKISQTYLSKYYCT